MRQGSQMKKRAEHPGQRKCKDTRSGNNPKSSKQRKLLVH